MTLDSSTGVTRNASDTLSDVVSNVLKQEANAILSIADMTNDSLVAAVNLIQSSSAPLIVAGVGKSGHICRKIASTFCSLGKRASFLHAAEARHGDLGLLDDGSVVLILSNSGETTELSDLLAYCREYSNPVVSITSSIDTALGRASTVAIAYGKLTEACVNGLAPTTSTTVALSLGDALAVGVSHLSKIKHKDFRRYHPGGSLGARLMTVSDLMHTQDALPVVSPDMEMHDVVIEISRKGFGTAIVCENNKVIGVITDGDMRRNVKRLWQSCAADLILGAPKVIAPDTLAHKALGRMNDEGITSIIVADDDKKLLGLLHIHDCLRAGVEI